MTTEITLHLPPEMADRGVAIFNNLRSPEGGLMAASFLTAFAAEPLQTPASEIFGSPAEDRNYHERARAASKSRELIVAEALARYHGASEITPELAPVIADLIQMHHVIKDADTVILGLMPVQHRNDESASEETFSVSQKQNFEPLACYRSSNEIVIDGLDPAAALDSLKVKVLTRLPVTTTEIAERFLAEPNKLLSMLDEITAYVRTLNTW